MRDTFLRSGDVGRDLLEVDWRATPLGPLEEWPSSLEAVVRMVLSSRFAMWMAWGDELTFFCNDAYRRDTLGTKYPWALGKPASVVWSEIWHDIGPRVERVMSTGVATWDEHLQLFLERSGYSEETYHTFSYSPLADDSGQVAGLLCVVSEDTEEVLSHRRLATLRDLASRPTGEPTVAETVGSACAELATSDLDLPFVLVYLHEDDGTARLAARTGFHGPHPAAPDVLGTDDPSGPAWPVPPAGTGHVVVRDLDRHEDLPTGGWKVPPDCAAVLPLEGPHPPAYGFLVVGLNPFRPFDEEYADFLELVAGQVAAGVTDARAYELERQRAESLAALDQAKTDFFTNVSHELRTPLTLLLGPTEDALLDAEEPLGPGQRRRVEVVQRNAQRLLKLVNTLLDFSRLESGRVDPVFEPVDLAEYTGELAATFESAAQRLGLVLALELAELPGPVHVDRELWAKVVLNLVSNALKFTHEGGITVSVAAEDGEAVLAVSDTGVGVHESEQPHLFERFRRASGSRSRSHEGSGIGLALVAEFAELHGGSVGVRSTPGVGSRFEVRVPLGTDHLDPERLAGALGVRGVTRQVLDGFRAEADDLVVAGHRAPTERPAVPGDERPRVLVVEDHADVREYVADLLGGHYAVSTAVDGQDGFEQALAAAPDLVLTDVMMPRMNGFELLTALRAEPATVGIPVVMLSARAGEDGTIEGLEAGADDYLAKPFTARELLARVRSNLELDRARRTREHLETSRDLLDQAQRLAQTGSWEIDLTTGRMVTTEEFRRIMGLTREEIEELGYPEIVMHVVHPDDRAEVIRSIAAARDEPRIRYEVRIVRPDGEQAYVNVHGEAQVGPDGQTTTIRGSLQDVTERRRTAEVLAAAQADAEGAAREHAIATELQRSLLPETSFDLEHLEVATYYRAGVQGTQVGGDWYDVIELDRGRTALVVGDVMGRGVRAAAVMGQLRAAVRAYARLDLSPTDLLSSLEGIVGDIGPDHIVTCVYAVFDPADLTLRYANAGHLPLLVRNPDGEAVALATADNPPLGVGHREFVGREAELVPGAVVLLYTDGLVERRGEDLDRGIESLRRILAALDGPLADAPQRLVTSAVPEGPDDDVAVLVARTVG